MKPYLYNGSLTEYARQNRRVGLLAEVRLWEKLRRKQLGARFTKQKVIGNYIVDFYCKQYNVVIEVDGVSHENKHEYDIARDEYMTKMGITVLRFSDVEVLTDMAGVLRVIRGTLPVAYTGDTPPEEGK